MLKEKDHLEIVVTSDQGDETLYIYPFGENDHLYEVDNPPPGAAPYQLLEGCSYSYELVGMAICQLDDKNDMVKHHKSPKHPCEGTIKTGINVGHLALNVEGITYHGHTPKVHLEIRSKKADYESDYQRMLDDIAEYYTDLVLQQNAPVTQKMEVDANTDSQTLYQRFSFVRSLIDSEAFGEAIHKIMANPIKKWTETLERRNIVAVRRMSRNNIRQIAASTDRVELSQTYGLGLKSVPRNITVEAKRDTVDNQENQFVKFVLRQFVMFCSGLMELKNASDRLKDEAAHTIQRLYSFLDQQFFRQVSMPTHMNLNSPVLQRKEGYREVLQSWLLFDLAAKLNWTGGDDVYDAGKKNVATLYEYWLFFKLLELIGEFFEIKPKDKKDLVTSDDDNIDLNIKQGRMQVIRGQQKTHSRLLNVAFYYNRTFSKKNDENAILQSGSWTMSMRPDYTLSIWPGNITETEAEAQELVTHIHFDAKYRLNKVLLEDIDSNINDSEKLAQELQQEKTQQELGIYKRADLLKMHAYKDAIRRTSGAYVLYPGDQKRQIRGFHEVIPGLGAFSVRPGHWAEDSIALKQFLNEIKMHLLNRASDREKIAFYNYEVYREENKSVVMESLPEPVGKNRDFMPDKTTVLVAYYKNEAHLNWILQEKLYNARSGDMQGAIRLDDDIMNARYILLHHENECKMLRLTGQGPKVYSRYQLVKTGYPKYKTKLGQDDLAKEAKHAGQIYIVFNIKGDVEEELKIYAWSLDAKQSKRKKPFSMKLVDLIEAAKRATVDP